jgi:hypothetical protein
MPPKTHSAAPALLRGSFPPTRKFRAGRSPGRKDVMKPYIPKQPKHARERIEAKLDERLVRRLEHYCRYLESDRDYVLAQVLEIAFRKDKGFTAWLHTHGQESAAAGQRQTEARNAELD